MPSVVVEVVDGDVAVATVRIDGDVPMLFVVDAMARIELAARRLGWTVRLREVCGDLRELTEFCGLPLDGCGQAERREQRGVEEVVEPDEPPP